MKQSTDVLYCRNACRVISALKRGGVIVENEIMVKVCSKCGIVNTERAKKCEECGAKLGAAVKNSETEDAIEKVTKRNKKIKKAIESEKYGGGDEKTPYIPVTASRIVIGVIGILVAVALIVGMVLTCLNSHENGYELFTIGGGGLILVVLAVLYCFAPSQMWALSHFGYQLRYKEMPEPSDAALVFQQIASVILILLGGAIFVFQLIALCDIFNSVKEPVGFLY